ncbi:MAG: tetratricopeptide repeat protein [Bacteroidetes bacterium]|nr:tetratricopeptide repeat protein [Bacteroidota bacterium]
MKLGQIWLMFSLGCCLFLKASASVSNPNPDSLVRVANSMTTDTAKVIQYFKFAALYAHSPGVEKVFEDSALAISKRINYTNGLFRAYRNLSGYYWRIEEYSKAIEYNSYRKALAIEMKDSIQLASSYNTEGLSYSSLGEYDKALDAFNAGINVYKHLGNEKLAVFLLGNVAAVYLSLKNYEKAESLLRQCLASDHKFKNTYSIGNDCQLMGDVFLESERPDSAFIYYTKSLSLSDSSEFFVKAGSLKGLGKIYFRKGDYANALQCFTAAIEAGKGGRAKSVLRDVYLQLSYLYEKMNMPQKALEAHRLYFSWNDSTNILVKRNQLAYSEMIKQNALKDF